MHDCSADFKIQFKPARSLANVEFASSAYS